MANQTIAKPLGLIKDLKIIIHGIPYVVTHSYDILGVGMLWKPKDLHKIH
jgi:hypothetical protein